MTRPSDTMLSRRSPLLVTVAGVVCAAAAAAGCGGGPTASGPSWASSLGTGVTVVSPRSETPGHGSPGGVVVAYVEAENSGRLSGLCPVIEPAGQSTCRKAIVGASTDGAKVENFKLGYVVIKGDQAVVGLTGTNCNPGDKPVCSTNTDPAAIFSSGRTFGALFSQAVASQVPTTTNSYSLAPCVRVDGQWYIDVPTSDL